MLNISNDVAPARNHSGGHYIYLTPILFTPFLVLGGFATSLLLYVILKFYRRSIHPYFFMIFFCFCQVQPRLKIAGLQYLD